MKTHTLDVSALQRKSPFGMFCAAAALAIAPQVQALVVTQGDMNPANWTQTTATVSGNNATLNMTALPSGGNPGSYWENRFTLSTLNSGLNQIRVFNIFNSAGFNPATQGALTSLAFSFDTEVVTSPFLTAGFISPGIEQDGRFFRRTLGATEVNGSGWQTRTFDAHLESEWFEIGTNLQPDFSENGATLHFGYAASIGAQCQTGFLCSATTIVSGLDNFRVEVLGAGATNTNNVPEPGSLALACLGLLVMGCRVGRSLHAANRQASNRSGCLPLKGA